MYTPPTYPRIPHLPGSSATTDDLWARRRDWFGHPVVVEEKVDGSNVRIWMDDGKLLVSGRSGVGAPDRADQLGRLRAWAASHDRALRDLCERGRVVHAEWMWLQHTIPYTRLPSYLLIFDIWTAQRGFWTAAERDRICRKSGLSTVVVLHRGRLAPDDLPRLTEISQYRDGPAEGVVLRREQAGRLLDRAKWVRPGFVPKPDEAWRRPYPRNRLRPA